MAGRLWIALALGSLAAAPAASDERSFEGRLKIGSTGVMCVKEPCPRIGVLAASEPGKPRFGRPMFAGDAPPPMSGATADQEAVAAAWRADGCLVIEGRFSRPPLLEIDRVEGPCGPHD
ncbi:hypothetical protein [Chenggangzhangella methanolivorans]|uniref:DUF2147 domain-containing protein n=1 Tax=Chenggangzhangella methanolivorans TaxID=1437009 RepID=A0A9E6UNM6_9HYPH|nr:hypothetical protein [Chenggangzhangella methanolivorans]QZN98714.1 hypothetical protein K6K41_17155 [Chenggangzhangella methanolivorans]